MLLNVTNKIDIFYSFSEINFKSSLCLKMLLSKWSLSNLFFKLSLTVFVCKRYLLDLTGNIGSTLDKSLEI
jgi:hypothetical protein